uniref:Uncharacterized protein n=1 Tax=Opuntia streptacantha TaxID=393608 RepID=A0A7C9DZX3_OPUST
MVSPALISDSILAILSSKTRIWISLSVWVLLICALSLCTSSRAATRSCLIAPCDAPNLRFSITRRSISATWAITSFSANSGGRRSRGRCPADAPTPSGGPCRIIPGAEGRPLADIPQWPTQTRTKLRAHQH